MVLQLLWGYLKKKGSSHVETRSEQILRMEELAGWEEPPARHLDAEFWSSPDCWSKWSWTENVS